MNKFCVLYALFLSRHFSKVCSALDISCTIFTGKICFPKYFLYNKVGPRGVF